MLNHHHWPSEKPRYSWTISIKDYQHPRWWFLVLFSIGPYPLILINSNMIITDMVIHRAIHLPLWVLMDIHSDAMGINDYPLWILLIIIIIHIHMLMISLMIIIPLLISKIMDHCYHYPIMDISDPLLSHYYHNIVPLMTISHDKITNPLAEVDRMIKYNWWIWIIPLNYPIMS